MVGPNDFTWSDPIWVAPPNTFFIPRLPGGKETSTKPHQEISLLLILISFFLSLTIVTTVLFLFCFLLVSLKLSLFSLSLLLTSTISYPFPLLLLCLLLLIEVVPPPLLPSLPRPLLLFLCSSFPLSLWYGW